MPSLSTLTPRFFGLDNSGLLSARLRTIVLLPLTINAILCFQLHTKLQTPLRPYSKETSNTNAKPNPNCPQSPLEVVNRKFS